MKRIQRKEEGVTRDIMTDNNKKCISSDMCHFLILGSENMSYSVIFCTNNHQEGTITVEIKWLFFIILINIFIIYIKKFGKSPIWMIISLNTKMIFYASLLTYIRKAYNCKGFRCLLFKPSCSGWTDFPIDRETG